MVYIFTKGIYLIIITDSNGSPYSNIKTSSLILKQEGSQWYYELHIKYNDTNDHGVGSMSSNVIL